MKFISFFLFKSALDCQNAKMMRGEIAHVFNNTLIKIMKSLLIFSFNFFLIKSWAKYQACLKFSLSSTKHKAWRFNRYANYKNLLSHMFTHFMPLELFELNFKRAKTYSCQFECFSLSFCEKCIENDLWLEDL